MTRAINVAEAKRRFSELLARTAFAGERFLIARRGKPLAALVAVADLEHIQTRSQEPTREPPGLLGAARALADYRGLERVMADVHRSRRRSRRRRVTLS